MLFGISNTLAEKIPEVPGVKLSPEKLDLARQIRAVFADAPIMVRVAMCESGLVHRENGELFRSKVDGLDFGVFQVRLHVHHTEMRRLGLNHNNLSHYFAYVRYLYDTQGLTPWKSSRHCWGKSKLQPYS